MTDDEFLLGFQTCRFARPSGRTKCTSVWPGSSCRDSPSLTASIASARHSQAQRQDRPAGHHHRAPTRPRDRTSNGDPNGYHETITIAFARIIAGRLRSGESFFDFRERNPDLLDRKLPALTRGLFPALLRSPEARRAFVDPDIEPLPRAISTECEWLVTG